MTIHYTDRPSSKTIGGNLTDTEIQILIKALAHPFYEAPDFWINLVLGVGGVGFSILAYREARAAKEEAKRAGRTVKIQTVAIELTETSLKLDRLGPEIKYRDARDLLSETSRRIRRSISPFATDDKLKDAIAALVVSVDDAIAALNLVRPTDPSVEDQAPQAVYNAIETHFAKITNDVASLIGLLEKQTSNIGE